MGLFVYLWLYYSVFAVAWFLVGFGAKHYVSTHMKRLDAGITALLTPVDTDDGTDTMEDSNSHLAHGGVWLEWDFPDRPRFKSKSIVPTASINMMGILGGNGLNHPKPVGYDDLAIALIF